MHLKNMINNSTFDQSKINDSFETLENDNKSNGLWKVNYPSNGDGFYHIKSIPCGSIKLPD